MRFRLHTQNASSGQVKKNTAAIDALLLRVDELESSIEQHGTAGTESAGTIDITTGVNDTFVFRHVLAVSMASTTYTIVFASGSFTTEELLMEMNAAVVAQGSVANGITTTVAFINDRFVIRCTSGSVVFGIQVLGSGASAAESLGFGQTQAAGVFGDEEAEEADGGDLELVAANTVPVDSAGAAPTQDAGASDEDGGGGFDEEEGP